MLARYVVILELEGCLYLGQKVDFTSMGKYIHATACIELVSAFHESREEQYSNQRALLRSVVQFALLQHPVASCISRLSIQIPV